MEGGGILHTSSGAQQALKGARHGWENEAETRLACSDERWDNPFVATGGDVSKKEQEAEASAFSTK